MTIVGKTGGRGTAAISNRYPAVDGLTGGTTTQTGHKMSLVPQETKVSCKLKRGIDGR